MERTGLDSLEGLFIALICCLISTLLYGASGLSSMMFVASITRYDTDRNKASFPFILSTVFQAVTGPFAGYFAKRFNVRVVVLTGSFLAFLGIGTCFFAEDIATVTVLWGVVFGIGFGLSSLLLPAIINEYFYKNRSIALGMCYLGSPVGFFVFPPIFEMLFNVYGLSGTFLILSAIILHCVPLSMLLRQPNFKMKPEECSINSESCDSYLNIQFKDPNQVPKFEIKNKSLNGVMDSYARRHSVEFLWKSTEHLIHNDKEYVLSLNKNSPGKQHGNRNITRSFKKTSRNHYKTLDKKDPKGLCDSLRRVTNKSDTADDALSKLNENDACFNSVEKNKRVQGHQFKQPLEISDKFPRLKFDSSSECKKLQSEKNQEYEEMSTIYFGTDQSLAECKSRLNSQLSHKNELNSLFLSSQAPEDKIVDLPTLLTYRTFDEASKPSADGACDKQISTVALEIESDTDSSSSMIDMYLNPVFILMCVINAVVNLHFTVVTTVIIDFSRDQKIEVDYEKYIMMCISLMGAIGMLGFGWITDGGYLTRTNFGSLFQLVSCLSTIVLPFTTEFETLMVALAVWCTFHSSIIPLIPAITADYFVEDMQSVAISACNVLCGPLYFVIPPLIGYFRDYRGSYDNIFFLLGILSFLNCIAVITIPALARWRPMK